MTCKDCLHYEACKGTYYEIHEFGNFDEEGYASSKCDHFKDKSKNIEVPCKVSDITKEIIKYLKDTYSLFDYLCKRLQDDYNGEKPFEQHEEDRIFINDLLEKIDKLKERENNA